MGGSQQHKRSKARRLRVTTQGQSSKPKKKSRWIAISTIAGVLVTVISLPSIISVFNTSVGISPVGPSKAGDPLRVKFQISNESSFSIYHVIPQANVMEAKVGTITLRKVSLGITPSVISEIEASSRPVTFLGGVSIPYERSPNDLIRMVIVVRFKASFTFWPQFRARHFVGHRLPNGDIEWEEVPSNSW